MTKKISFVLLTITFSFASAAWAAPGDLIVNVPLAVPGNGVSVANNCAGEIYYTHTNAVLYKMNAAGTDLGSVSITNVAGGAPVVIDEMAWDESRQILWGQEHGSNPVDVYQINAATGVATFSFSAIMTTSLGTFRDGIAYDGTDDSLWLTGDVSDTVEHYTTGGAFISQITPLNGGGGTLGSISGITVGNGDLLYLGRNGAVEIVQVQKSDGAFLSSFASPFGTRDEGLECDAFSFSPLLALWSREFDSPGDITAIEIEPGTCACGGVEIPPVEGTFTVNKEFSDNNAGSVTVTLSCSSGNIVANGLSASEGSPAVFSVIGFTQGATCTATESDTPGYSENDSDCQDNDPINGSCTMVNTLDIVESEVTPVPTTGYIALAILILLLGSIGVLMTVRQR